MEELKEIWKDIIGHEDLYMVSNLGRVKSLPKPMANPVAVFIGGMLTREKIMKNIFNPHNGYCSVSLRKERNNPKRHYIHRLVAAAFLPNPLNKAQVNHKNGVRDDNGLSNLEWVSCSENKIHAFNTGLTKTTKGERHPKAVLNDEKVLDIRRLFNNGGYSQKELAQKYSVSAPAIQAIVSGKTWKHI